MIQAVEQHRARAAAEGKPTALYEGALIALEVLMESCWHYEAEAREQAESAADPQRRSDLTALIDTLAALREGPPQTFQAAMQLFWFYSIVGNIRNHGRMDVYLGDFLARDLDGGRLTEDEALRLRQSLWHLMAARNTRVYNRVIVGGKGRPNEADADRFALLAMEATRTVLEVEPQLSLRFYDEPHPALMQKALEVTLHDRTGILMTQILHLCSG